jgi:hypothetical protein
MALDQLFGSVTTKRILLHLFHYGEIHANGIAHDYGSAVTPFLRQLNRLEESGLLVSKLVGRTRLYQLNPKSAYTNALKKLIQVDYETMPLLEREKIFHERRRPRRKGKPVIS